MGFMGLSHHRITDICDLVSQRRAYDGELLLLQRGDKLLVDGRLDVADQPAAPSKLQMRLHTSTLSFLDARSH